MARNRALPVGTTGFPMNDHAGVWIDHHKAIIVGLTPDGEVTLVIPSKVEKHLERGGDSPMEGAYESRQVPADDSRQRALTGGLNIYYDAVIAPGEAKKELHSRLTKSKLGARVAAIEAADKMTDRQLVAKVRTYFGAAAPRKQPPS
jgi:hypothetical protein